MSYDDNFRRSPLDYGKTQLDRVEKMIAALAARVEVIYNIVNKSQYAGVYGPLPAGSTSEDCLDQANRLDREFQELKERFAEHHPDWTDAQCGDAAAGIDVDLQIRSAACQAGHPEWTPEQCRDDVLRERAALAEADAAAREADDDYDD